MIPFHKLAKGRQNRRNEREIRDQDRQRLAAATLLYALFVVYGSLIPLHYRSMSLAEGIAKFREIEYLNLGVGHRADWVANILLFIPLSFLLSGATGADRHGLGNLLKGIACVVTCITLSLLLEFAQLWFPPRTVSQNDLVAESLGSIIGTVAWLTLGERALHWVQSSGFGGHRRQFDWLLECYLIGYLIYQLLPLDLSLSLTELWQKYQAGRLVWLPFSDLPKELAPFSYNLFRDFVTLIPVGIMVAVWKMPLGNVRPWRERLTAGLTVMVGIEFLQCFVASRYGSVTDILIGLTSILIVGRFVESRSAKLVNVAGNESVPLMWRDHGWRSVVVVLYSAFVFGLFCYPLNFSNDAAQLEEAWRGFWTIPFARLYWGTEFNAVSNVISRLSYFFPLGAFGADWVYRTCQDQGARWLGYGVVFILVSLLGLAIELAQLFSPVRYADSTDVALYGLGGLLGVIVIHWLYRTPTLAWVPDSEAQNVRN